MVHNRRAATGRTDWPSIIQLYDGLLELAPTIGAVVARAAAVREVSGGEAALSQLRDLPDVLVRTYQPYWALTAHCHADLGDSSAAAHCAQVAIGLAEDPAIRRYLDDRFLASRTTEKD